MAIDMFLQIGSLKGESEDKQFEKWIDVLNWSWGGTQSGTAGQGGGMGGGKVSFHNFSFVKYTDIVTPKILTKMASGEHFPTAKFRARKAGGSPFVYLEMDFDDVIVTSYSTGGSGGQDRTTENISFDFKKYTSKYIQQSKSGGTESDDQMTFNVATNSVE